MFKLPFAPLYATTDPKYGTDLQATDATCNVSILHMNYVPPEAGNNNADLMMGYLSFNNPGMIAFAASLWCDTCSTTITVRTTCNHLCCHLACTDRLPVKQHNSECPPSLQAADAVDKVCNECGTAVQITGEAEATLRIPTVGQQQQYDSVPLFVTAEAIMHAMRYSMTTAVGMFTSGNKTDIYHDTAAEVRCKLAHFQVSTTFSCKHASHVCPTSI
jgi:hypothetical protein